MREAAEYEKRDLAELQRREPLTPAKQRKREEDAHKEDLYGRTSSIRLEDIHRETWQVEIKALVDEQNQELATYDVRTQQRRRNELGLYTKPGKRSQKVKQVLTPKRTTTSFRSAAGAVRAAQRLKDGGELMGAGNDFMGAMMMSKSVAAGILENDDDAVSDYDEEELNNFEQELAENEDLRREMELLENQVEQRGTSQAELDSQALASARDDAASAGIGMTISSTIPDDDEMAAIDALISKREAGLGGRGASQPSFLL